MILFIAWVLFIILCFIDGAPLRIIAVLAFTGYVGYLAYKEYTEFKYPEKEEKAPNAMGNIRYLLQTLKGTMQLKTVLSLILKDLISALELDRAIVYTLKHKGTTTTIEFTSGYTKHGEFDTEYTCPFIGEKSILARSIIEAKPYIIEDAAGSDICEQSLIKGLSLTSFCIVPIAVEGTILGVILVDNYLSKKPIPENIVETLDIYANQIGLAIENSKVQKKVERLILKDELTNVYNHRYFQEAVKKEFERTARYKHPLSLMVVDIDDFDYYNDKHGFMSGDLLLKEVADFLVKNVRNIDTLARFTGEDFVVILPETGKEDALAVAEKIRKLVEEKEFRYSKFQPNGKLTVSIGISNYPEDTDKLEILIEKAINCLGRAKQQGKNRVIVC